METLILKYREVHVINNKFVSIQDCTLTGPPQIIPKQVKGKTEVYITWLEVVDDRGDRKNGT